MSYKSTEQIIHVVVNFVYFRRVKSKSNTCKANE